MKQIFTVSIRLVSASMLIALSLLRPVQPVSAAGMVLYVDDSAAGSNDGTSWTDAYVDLQSALSAAVSGDQIWVAAGIYKPTSGSDRTVSFALQSGVEVYGGFSGTETLLDERDPQASLTVLSGDLNGDDAGFSSNGENSYHVVTAGGADSTALLDGFTITGGNADGTLAPDDRGGGYYSSGGSPTFQDVTFLGNSATQGGGMYHSGRGFSHSTFTDVTFSGNTAVSGGGLFNEGTLTITNGTFSANTATGSGDGGGAVTNDYALTISDSTFSGNSSTAADSNGGAILSSNPLTITGSTFSGNSAGASSGSGGALFNAGTATITNSTFSGNAAAVGGAIVTIQPLTIANSTIAGNSAVITGGLAIEAYTTDLSNTIIASNSASYPPSNDDCTNSATIGANMNNLIGDGSCSASLSGDPKLGPLQDNGGPTQTMAIDASSPALDAGDNASCPATDQTGLPRPQGDHCDIGAFEAEYADVDVLVGISSYESYSMAPGSSTRQSLAGVNDGPVLLASCSCIPLLGAARVIYKVNGVNTSFSETMVLPDSQVDTTYWLPWYNNKDLDTQLRFGNVSFSTATVHVYIGDTEMTGSPFTLEPWSSMRQSFPGVNNGPVKIVSDVPIVAAERVIYKVKGVNTSFSEMMALPDSQVDTTYWLPWYNNVDLNTQLRIANVTTNPATVTVTIGDVPQTPINLAAGKSTRVSYPGINTGPVKIVSTQDIVAAERVIYKVNGIETSFSETMALPESQLDTTYWLPWYNNVDLDTQLRFGNVSGTTASVHVYIRGSEMAGSPFTLEPGASTRQSFAGINDGPVKIVSDVPIVAAERVIYRVNGINTSFSELMALPDSQLDIAAWLPWYNSVDLDTQLRFAVP